MVEYIVDGQPGAPVLVLSNSLGTTWSMWNPLIPALSRHFQVLRYNTRGHGGSALPDTALTLGQLGQDVVDLLDHLDIGQACFCGISLGGLTGMWLNQHAGARFHGLAVANTAARIGNEEAWRTRAEQVRHSGMAAIVEGTPARWFTDRFIQQYPERVTALLTTLGQSDPAGYAACCDVLARADLRPTAALMTRPMLAIAGEQDPVTTVADAQWLVEQTPDTRQISLPASHLSSVECPAAFAQALLAFFTQQGVIDA